MILISESCCGRQRASLKLELWSTTRVCFIAAHVLTGGSVAECFRALDLKSGVTWFKSSTLLLSGFVLGIVPSSTPRPRCVNS